MLKRAIGSSKIAEVKKRLGKFDGEILERAPQVL